MVQQERQFPPPNEVLERRRISQEISNHKKRLQNARPVIDTRCPPLHLHLHVKLKKLQTEADRRKEIHCENMRLLERMNQIMERNPPYKDNLRNRCCRSLNFQKSREEQHKIMQENQRLFQKLLKADSGYFTEKRPRCCKTANSSGKNCRSSSYMKKEVGSENARNKLSMSGNCVMPLRSDAGQHDDGHDTKPDACGSQKKPHKSIKLQEDMRKVLSSPNLLNVVQDRVPKAQTEFTNAESKMDDTSYQWTGDDRKSDMQVKQKRTLQNKRNIKCS